MNYPAQPPPLHSLHVNMVKVLPQPADIAPVKVPVIALLRLHPARPCLQSIGDGVP